MKILVVDDENVIMRGIVDRIEAMESFSGRVLGATSGEEALRIMEYFRPDILMTDIEMPGIDGLSLLSIVHERNLCGNVIIITAFDSFLYAQKAVQYHATDYLLKPVDWAVLESYIREYTIKAKEKKSLDSVLSEYSSLFVSIEEKEFSNAFSRLLRYVGTYYCNDISLKQVAIHMDVSENSVCNLFRKELGVTFLDYISQLRLKKGMELLLMSQKMPVKEISTMLGYNSERQFFRLFKSYTGLTPQSFRERNLYEKAR